MESCDNKTLPGYFPFFVENMFVPSKNNVSYRKKQFSYWQGSLGTVVWDAQEGAVRSSAWAKLPSNLGSYSIDFFSNGKNKGRD